MTDITFTCYHPRVREEGGAVTIVRGWTKRPPRPLLGPLGLGMAALLCWPDTQVSRSPSGCNALYYYIYHYYNISYNETYLRPTAALDHLRQAAVLTVIFLASHSGASDSRGDHHLGKPSLWKR